MKKLIDISVILFVVQFIIYNGWRIEFFIKDLSPKLEPFQALHIFFNVLFFGPISILIGIAYLLLYKKDKKRVVASVLLIGVGVAWMMELIIKYDGAI